MSLQLELPTQFYDELYKQTKKIYIEAVKEARQEVGITREFLTISEAIELIGISRNTLTNNFITNGLPTYCIEGKTWIKKTELYDFIEQHKK